jgi:plasmid stability protein
MKNVTIALDDEVHRRARIHAATMGTSLSALVKGYLESLDAPLEVGGVREMPMPFAAQPAPVAQLPPNPDNAPYFVDGKWVFTKDGKPRTPGALKGKLWVADDFDETPEWLLDAFEGKDSHLPWPDPE